MPPRRTKAPSVEPVPMAGVSQDRVLWQWLVNVFPRWRAGASWDQWPPQLQACLPMLIAAVADELRRNRSETISIRGTVSAWHWVSEWLLKLCWNERIARRDRALFAEIGRAITVAIAPHYTLSSIESEEAA